MAAAGAPAHSSTAVVAAFFALVAIQVLLALSYKAAQDASGHYPFSPASILVLAEFVKLCMAAGALFVAAPPDAPPLNAPAARARAVWAAFRREALETCGGRLPLMCAGLALLYCVNNNLMFFVFRLADGANINLVKSGATFVSAVIMWRFLARPVSRVQWAAILIQGAGLVVTQFGAKCGDKSAASAETPLLSPLTYLMLLGSLTITSFSGVWNDKLMKDSAREGVSINTISVLLYAAGAALNTLAHLLSAARAGGEAGGGGGGGGGFFRGLGEPAAIFCLLCNSLIGIAVTAVYKYADAVVKTLAGAFSTSVLFFISAAFFGVPVNVVVAGGCVCIFTATYLYVTSPAPAPAPAPAGAEGAKAPGGGAGGAADAPPAVAVAVAGAPGAATAAAVCPTAREAAAAAVIIAVVCVVFAEHITDVVYGRAGAGAAAAGAVAGARALAGAALGAPGGACAGGDAWRAAECTGGGW